MNPMIRRWSMALWLLVLCAALPACNTIQGAGKDIEKAGEVVQDAARDGRR